MLMLWLSVAFAWRFMAYVEISLPLRLQHVVSAVRTLCQCSAGIVSVVNMDVGHNIKNWSIIWVNRKLSLVSGSFLYCV